MAWYTAAGGTTCVAAYNPVGASSLANSYVNLVNPGTNDAAPGTAPTWAYGTGWGGRMCYNYQSKNRWPGAIAVAPAVSHRRVIPMTTPDCTPDSPQVKTCSKCGEAKPFCEFCMTQRWYRRACRECERARCREYYAKNIDGQRRRASSYRANNRDATRERHREWVSRNRSRVCEYSAARRAMNSKATVEKVSRDAVYERDGGRCHVCGKKRPRNDWHLDHLIPLTKGGSHSMVNVAVACPSCNVRRYNNGPAQLRLIGDA